MTEKLKILKQGAEAKLYVCNYLGRPTLIKERFKNLPSPRFGYVYHQRTYKNEARSIVRCKSVGVKTPALYLVDFERRRIYMEHFENSFTVKDFIINTMITSPNTDSLNNIAKMIGETVRKMHENNIIHGDLTTSNMLLVYKSEISDLNAFDLAMIDFGLSYIDASMEDKGVDLYVLERALISTHNDVPELFPKILEAYKSYSKNNVKEIINKFEEVRAGAGKELW